MLKVKGIADNRGLENLFKLFDGYTDAVFDLAEETFRELQPQHLMEWRKQPRVRSYPGDYPGGYLPFDTEKQRGWYWANIGKPHRRSGQMTQGLMQWITRQDRYLNITASYENKWTKYVLGNIQGEEVKAYQQRFHKATGWQLSAPLLKNHAQAYVDRFVRRYEAMIAFYGK